MRCCNPIGACVAVADRVGVGRALAGAGVAVPPAILDGAPVSPMFAGPWMIQKFVDGDGFVRKIYVTGRHVRVLVKAAG